MPGGYLVSPAGVVSGRSTVSIDSRIALRSRSASVSTSDFFVDFGTAFGAGFVADFGAALGAAFDGVFVTGITTFFVGDVASDGLDFFGVDRSDLSVFGAGLGSTNSSSDEITSALRFVGVASFLTAFVGVFFLFSFLVPFVDVAVAR